jgi:hypothetical protein
MNLGRPAGQRGQGSSKQTGGGTTVLVDATVRLLDEFAYKKAPLTQPSLQLAEKGKEREDDDTNPFIPTYVYEAMKEKRQFKSMLVRYCAHAVPFCH